ncbi:MAG: plasmid pRiA4b ORF-3 family protein [Acidobacteria bacterium]|nr:plasmid pRiA4b ORF-3 family protein [Acidobacteriota bacterium]MCI0722153.1 plasmid pRiA4b ORF-3 family protein [Acidobacteriota bacterium]
MKKSFSQIHQFKISLLGIRPQIWRRIEVPDTYTFWDLHVAIQDSMGWLDYHLHEFEIPNPETRQPDCIGIPDDEWDDDREVLAGWRTPIDSYFSLKNSLALYKYDFGDGWEHEVRLEGIAAREPKRKYPRCLEGARACPPEDVGGVSGYRDFLKAIKNPRHPEHLELLEWSGGGSFDPERFSAARIRFGNPKTRLRNL